LLEIAETCELVWKLLLSPSQQSADLHAIETVAQSAKEKNKG
jgi:hypothetical protein